MRNRHQKGPRSVFASQRRRMIRMSGHERKDGRLLVGREPLPIPGHNCRPGSGPGTTALPDKEVKSQKSQRLNYLIVYLYPSKDGMYCLH